jgi:hypothetical protein
MFLFATIVACVEGLHVEGTVEDSDGSPWSNTIRVDILAADDVGVDGAEPYDTSHSADFAFDVPAGDWVVVGAAGTCSGQSDVSGSDGDSVTATVSMICVE